jgi:bisphosphoglycerate-independent phosphoglycerate mutase (AlkP superfamily)
VVHAGQGDVAVEVSVPVAGEVLAASGHATALQAPREGDPERGHPVWTIGEGSITDDRVGRIGVHVEDGGEIDAEAEGGEHPGDRRPGTPAELRVVG